MKIFNSKNYIFKDIQSIAESISRHTAPGPGITHHMFYGSHHKKAIDCFDNIIKTITTSIKNTKNCIIIENKNTKDYNIFTHSLINDKIKSPLYYFKLKITTLPLTTALILVVLSTVMTVLITWISMFIDGNYSFFVFNEFKKAYNSQIVQNILWFMLISAIQLCIIMKDKKNKKFSIALKIQNIIENGNYKILKDILIKKINSENKPIFLAIKTIEKLNEEELKIIYDAIKQQAGYNIVFVSYSAAPGSMRHELIDDCRLYKYAIKIDTEDTCEEDFKSDSKKNIKKIIVELDKDNKDDHWSPWTLFMIMGIGSYMCVDDLSLNHLELAIKNDLDYLNKISKALGKESIDDKTLNQYYESIRTKEKYEPLYFRTNDIRFLDYCVQVEIANFKTEQRNIELISLLFWLFYILKKRRRNGYSYVNSTRLITAIISKYKSQLPVLPNELREELKGYFPDITSSGSPELAYAFSKLMLCLKEQLTESQESDLLGALVLYGHSNIHDIFNIAAETAKNNKYNNINTFFSTFTDGIKNVEISWQWINTNGLSYPLSIFLVARHLYVNSLLPHSITTVFKQAPINTINIQDESLIQLIEGDLRIGGFNIATYSMLPILSSLSRMGMYDLFIDLALKYEIGLRNYAKQQNSWAKTWFKIVSLIILAECFKIIGVNSEKNIISNFGYHETLNTTGHDRLTTLANNLLQNLGINSRLKDNTNITIATLQDLDNAFREMIFTLTVCDLQQLTSFLDLYFFKFTNATRKIDACDKRTIDDLIMRSANIREFNSPIILLFHPESYLETIDINSKQAYSLCANDAESFHRHLNKFAYASNTPEDVTRNFISILRLCDSKDAKRYATLLLYDIYKKNHVLFRANSNLSLGQIDLDLEFLTALQNLKKTRFVKKIYNDSLKSFASISRPEYEDEALATYISCKIWLTHIGINLFGIQKGHRESILSILTSRDASLILPSDLTIALHIYFEYIHFNTTINIKQHVMRLTSSNSADLTEKYFGLIFIMYDHAFRDKTKDNHIFKIFYHLLSIFSESNYFSISTKSIIYLMECFIHTDFHEYSRSIHGLANALLATNRKRDIIIYLRESLQNLKKEKRYSKIADAFYSLYELTMYYRLPQHIRKVAEEGTSEERIHNIRLALVSNDYFDKTNLWCKIYLLKSLEILYRKENNSNEETFIKRQWESAGIACIENFLSQIMNFDSDRELLELLNTSFALLTSSEVA